MSPSELLLALCRRDASPEALTRLLAETRRRDLGPALGRLADDNRVLDLILFRLNRSGLPTADSGLSGREAIAEVYRARCRKAMVIDLELGRVLNHFRAASIAPVLLKGAALRHAVYDASVERPMADIDLLVAADAFEPALPVLAAAGYRLEPAAVRDAYRRYHYHFRALHPAGVTIELHWALSRPGEAVQLDAGGFLSRARLLATKGRPPALVPAPEDLVLHAVEQALDDAFGSLRHLVDLDRIVAAAGPDLDWSALRSRARDAGLTPALAHAFRLAGRMLGTATPPGAVPRLAPLTRYHIDRLPSSPLLDERVRHATARRLVGFWLLAGSRARMQVILRAIRRPHDPMEWRWREIAGKMPAQTSPLDGIVFAVKNITYQIGVSLGLGAHFTRRHTLP